MEIKIYSDEYLQACAALSADAVRGWIDGGVVLSGAFADEGHVEAYLQGKIDGGASGVVALDKGRLAGFLLGLPGENEYFGRHVWSEVGMHGLAEWVDAELYRRLYAAAGELWLVGGYANHYVEVPAVAESALWTWFGLGFGQQQVYGALDIAAHSHSMFDDDGGGICIRRAGAGDEAILQQFAWNVAGYQEGAPVWAPTGKDEKAELEEGYGELATEKDFITWLAFDGDKPVGMQTYRPLVDAGDDILNVEGGIVLVSGSTMAEARGKGVGRLMTRHGLAYAREQGFKTCLIDWRSTNLLSAAFWPRMGFEAVVYRLERRVDWRG